MATKQQMFLCYNYALLSVYSVFSTVPLASGHQSYHMRY